MNDRVGGYAVSYGGSGASPGVSANIGGVGGSLSSSADAGGTVQVQLTGVLALVILFVVVLAAHKLK